jgi:hypothetical protein
MEPFDAARLGGIADRRGRFGGGGGVMVDAGAAFDDRTERA